MLFLDLDGFKPINDTYGHSKGDALLKAVAGRLVNAVAGYGQVGRIGGDEFAVVLPNIDGRKALEILAQRRSEERRVGKVCVRRCKYRWLTYLEKKNQIYRWSMMYRS